VATGATLRFSYIGQKTKNVKVGTSNTIDVALEEDAQALEEVVVVGYGTSTKEAFAGTAKTVKAENIEFKNFSNVSQALAGEAAGVTVINTSGQPGSTSTIRIRGFGSVNGNRDPLYVIDGVPYSGSLNAINPSDILNTTILKDATATAIYGSRGANGVILITTKSGASKESYIETDFKTGINAQLIPRYDVITSPEESIGLMWEAKRNRELLNGNADPAGTASTRLFGTAANSYLAPGYNMWNVANGAELIDPATGQVREGVTRRYTPERFEDIAFDSAIRTEANIRMGGADDKSNYFFSAGYLNDDGIAINTGYKRYTTRLNLKSQVKDWLSVGANIGYTYSESINNGQTNGAENLFEFADKMNPIYPVYLRDNNYELVPDPIFGGNQFDYGSNSGFRARPNSNNLNPIASALYDFNGNDRNEIVASINANIKVADGFTLETIYGAQYANNIFKSVGNQFYGVSTANEGDLFQSTTESIITNFLQLARYKKDFGVHSFEILAAHESNSFDRSFAEAYKGKSIVPQGRELDNYIVNLTNAEGRSEVRTLESYFSQLNYDYDNKYFLTATVRRDGSSRFAKDKWGTFGSIGAAWVASNEDFLADNEFITFLKVKASYGLTGDEAGVDIFSGLNTFEVTNVGGEFAVAPSVFANPDLTWEVAKQYQVGAEFSLGGFLDATLDYYIKDTENLFFQRRISPSTGVAVIDVNDGILRNRGLEFDLTGHLVKSENFKLDLSINGAFLNNEFNVMPLDAETGEPSAFQNAGLYGYAQGASLFDFYTREYAGVDPEDGRPMWNRYFVDANTNGTFDTGETTILSLSQYLIDNPDAIVTSETTKTYAAATQKFIEGKTGIPDVSGAFRLNAKFHNFSLSTQFTYSLGGYAYDSQYAELMHDNNGGITAQNRHVDVRNRWRQPGDITDVPLIADRFIPNVNSSSTRFITSTDFLALNNLLLSYDLPKTILNNIGVSALSMFVSGDNLSFLSVRQGWNPSTSENGSSGRGRYAPLSTFTFGVRAKF
jgi:TonB-linked SusC/RagA family outer membrane protein